MPVWDPPVNVYWMQSSTGMMHTMFSNLLVMSTSQLYWQDANKCCYKMSIESTRQICCSFEAAIWFHWPNPLYISLCHELWAALNKRRAFDKHNLNQHAFHLEIQGGNVAILLGQPKAYTNSELGYLFGRAISKQIVIHNEHIRFWPTLQIHSLCRQIVVNWRECLPAFWANKTAQLPSCTKYFIYSRLPLPSAVSEPPGIALDKCKGGLSRFMRDW